MGLSERGLTTLGTIGLLLLAAFAVVMFCASLISWARLTPDEVDDGGEVESFEVEDDEDENTEHA